MHTPDLEVSTTQGVEGIACPPELEQVTDRRQGYVPGLEFHQTDQEKHLQEHIPTQWQGPPTTSVSASSISCGPTPKSSQNNQRRATLKRKVWLIGAIVTVLVVIIIAATVAGVLVTRKQDRDQEKSTAPAAAASSTATTTSVAISPTASSALGSSSSDCSSLNTTYNVPANTARGVNAEVHYNIKCGCDFRLPLVMAMRTVRFEDCINACASQATNSQSPGCVAAVYKPQSGQALTCWLKSMGGANADHSSIGVDAAFIDGV